MADEKQTPQAKVYAAPDREGKDGANGHAQAKFAPNGHDGHEPGKYAPPKEEKKDEGAAAGGGDGGDQKPEKKPVGPVRRLLTIGIIAAVLVAALIYGWSQYTYWQNHTQTDDAYVTGNLVNVSPIISGTLSRLTVDEGDIVTKNQLVGRLEDSGQRAAVAQAQASYQAAKSQLPQAEQNLLYEQQATDAGIRRAQAQLAAQNAKTSGAQQQVVLSRATVLSQVRQAQSQVAQAQAQAAQADAQVRASQAAVRSQQQAVQTARRAADAATANISGAKSNAVRAQRDEARYAVLVQQEAVTPQQYDAARATADQAQSQLNALQYQAQQAQSAVNQAKANVAQAESQLNAVRGTADAARQQVDVARAGLGIAEANLSQIGIQQTNVVNNLGQNSSAQADLSSALAGRTQIQVRRDQISTFRAQADQARAALENAQVTEADTYLYAPNDGTVVKKAANIGASLSPGQTILTITQGDYVYVTANFKETQLHNVKPGEPAEVEVDAYPGRIFKGHVQSINEASGATQALLPPDNATGNFTKVVQRIPVRIELDAAKNDDDKKYARAADIHSLRQGESVTATIDTSSGKQ